MSIFNLFQSSPEKLAARGDLTGLTRILMERISQADLRRTTDMIFDGKPKSATPQGRFELRQTEAATLLQKALANHAGKGSTLATLGLAPCITKAVDAAISDKDKEATSLLGIVLYRLNGDSQANSLIEQLLLSEHGSDVWTTLCRNRDPHALHVLLPAVVKLDAKLKPEEAIWDPLGSLLDQAKVLVEETDSTEDYHAECLLPLLYKKKMPIRLDSALYEVLRTLLRPKTAQHRVIIALLQSPIDEEEIDALKGDAIAPLRELLAAVESDLCGDAFRQLERLDITLSSRDQVLVKLVKRDTSLSETVTTLGSEAAETLMEFLDAEQYGPVAAQALAKARYEKAAPAVLRRLACDVSWEWCMTAPIDLDKRGRLKDDFIRAAVQFGPCVSSLLSEMASSPSEGVMEAANAALKQVKGGTA